MPRTTNSNSSKTTISIDLENDLVFRTEALKNIKLDDKELENLLDLLENKTNSNVFTYISIILKDNFFKFIDLFEGETIEFPTYKELVKMIDDSKFYSLYQKLKELNVPEHEIIHKIAVEAEKSDSFIEKKLKRINNLLTTKQLELKLKVK